MVFTNLKYCTDQGGNNVSIQFTLNDQLYYVPLNSIGNIHYDEIMKQVEAKQITIAAAGD